MTLTIAIAPVRRSVTVGVGPARAFDIFANGIDSWWPKAQCDGASPFREMILEPFTGGRWYAICEDGSEKHIGRVLAWAPGRRLLLSWQIGMEGEPDPESASEVETNFIADGPHTTRIELEHRGFERLGRAGAERTRSSVEGGWPGVMAMYAEEVARRSHEPAVPEGRPAQMGS